jgi:hypothetical protein
MGLKSLRITQSVETEFLGEQRLSFLCLLKMRKDTGVVLCNGLGLFIQSASEMSKKISLAKKSCTCT